MAYKNKQDQKNYQNEYYKRPGRKESIIAKNKERRKNLRLKLRQIKIKSGCIKCGYNICSEALEFHHRNPEEKIFNIGTGCLASFAWWKIEEEMGKCDILCANCHRQVRCSCCG